MKREKPIGIISNSDLKHIKYKIIYWTMFMVLLILSISAIVPSIWVFLTGFKSSQEMYAIPATFFPKNPSIKSVVNAWNELQIGMNIISTFILAAGDIFFMVIVCGLGGYVLSRLKPKGTKLIFSLVIWTMMMPQTMRLVPLFMTFVDFPVLHVSMLNTYWPMFLSAAANCFNMMLFKNFFDSISISLIEAAKIDGARNMKIFFSIMVPLSVPVIVYTSIMTFNGVWSSYLMPTLVISNVKMQPIPAVIFRLKTSSDSSLKMNTYMMTLTIACIPPLITFAIFQRKILGGINVGGVKG